MIPSRRRRTEVAATPAPEHLSKVMEGNNSRQKRKSLKLGGDRIPKALPPISKSQPKTCGVTPCFGAGKPFPRTHALGGCAALRGGLASWYHDPLFAGGGTAPILEFRS